MTPLRIALVAVALPLALSTARAARVLEPVERAVELTLAELTLPSAGSTVSFRECARCGIDLHRLTSATSFVANGRAVPLADFLRIAHELAAEPAGAARARAVVFLAIATGRVTRIELRG
jgi:hypothetical protein